MSQHATRSLDRAPEAGRGSCAPSAPSDIANTNGRSSYARDEVLAIAGALRSLAERPELEAERDTLRNASRALRRCAEHLPTVSWLLARSPTSEPPAMPVAATDVPTSSIIVAPELLMPTPHKNEAERPASSAAAPHTSEGTSIARAAHVRRGRGSRSARWEDTVRIVLPVASGLKRISLLARCRLTLAQLLVSLRRNRGTARSGAQAIGFRLKLGRHASEALAWPVIFSCCVMLSVLGGIALRRSERAATAQAAPMTSSATQAAGRSAPALVATNAALGVATVAATPLREPLDRPSASSHAAARPLPTEPRIRDAQIVWGQASSRELMRALRRASKTIDLCWRALLEDERTPSQAFSVAMNVGRGGRAHHIELSPRSDSPAADCVRNAIQDTGFPRAKSGMRVSARFVPR